MLSALTAAVLAISAIVPPPPDPITIDVLTVTGSGCGGATTVVAMSADNTAFTVMYSAFTVQAQGQDARRDCELTLRVNNPPGYTYGIAATDYRGFAQLESGARGTETATYRFPGLPTRHSTQTFTGPMTNDWQVTDQPDPASVVHGPCTDRKPLTITTELKLNGKTGTSVMTMDTTDSSVSSKFRLSWLKC